MSNIIRINTITQLHEILGYSKPKHPLITLIDFSKMNIPYSNESVRVVTSFYTINLKRQCFGEMKYGRENYDFQEGTLMFMAPEQIVSIEVGAEPIPTEGWGLFIHPDLFRKSNLGNKINDYTFFSYEANEALHLSDDEKETITDIVTKIEEEFSQNIDVYSHDVIISNIELLMNYCNRFYGRQFITRGSQNKDVVTKFERLLIDYFKSDILQNKGIPSVKYISEQLNFSSNYLSDLLKKETGKNIQEHIHYQLIEQAKNKLLSSTETVSEIAYQLGFEYPQYFSKIFKKKTGMSPAQYRNLN